MANRIQGSALSGLYDPPPIFIFYIRRNDNRIDSQSIDQSDTVIGFFDTINCDFKSIFVVIIAFDSLTANQNISP